MANSPALSQLPLLQVGMVLYSHMTLLDLAGPQAVLGLHSKTHLVSSSLDPVLTDTGISIVPTDTFDSCPKQLDVLFVPGGFGVTQALMDDGLIRFLKESGRHARYVTSVCSGAVLLAAAGLLEGYKAATHWVSYEQMELLGGVQGVHERVVVDRNRMTGGGVTAGIDFGLTLLAELRGEADAKMIQLMLEYDPKPPFNSGTPEAAGPETLAKVMGVIQQGIDHGLAVAREFSRKQLLST